MSQYEQLFKTSFNSLLIIVLKTQITQQRLFLHVSEKSIYKYITLN